MATPRTDPDSSGSNLVNDDVEIARMLYGSKCIAVLGIKTERQSDRAAFSVPEYLVRAGFDVIPVPVYYPEVTCILGRTVYRRLVDVPDPIDIVNVFRRPEAIPAHLDDILAAHPKAVWMQAGIRNDVVARRLAQAGIKVVQDRCIMVDHRRAMRRR